MLNTGPFNDRNSNEHRRPDLNMFYCKLKTQCRMSEMTSNHHDKHVSLDQV